LRRLSVLGAHITYPRAARPIASLPDATIAAFRDILEGDRRGAFPRALISALAFVTCAGCGEAHARARCPSCAVAAPMPVAIAAGTLRDRAIDPRTVRIASHEITSARALGVWLDGGALWRTPRHALAGAERIGDVLAGQTRAWLGDGHGAGFYRAGGFAAGFVFRRDRGVLADHVALPPIRGHLVAAHAAIGDTHAWLVLVTATDGRITTALVAIALADAAIAAIADATDAPYAAGLPGACAAGTRLFVPTDDGIARLELVRTAGAGTATAIAHTRTFAATAPRVSSGDRLALAADGLDVLRAHDALRLHLA
jgi:hypothetical protein